MYNHLEAELGGLTDKETLEIEHDTGFMWPFINRLLFPGIEPLVTITENGYFRWPY